MACMLLLGKNDDDYLMNGYTPKMTWKLYDDFNVIDYEHFGRELKWDLDEEEDSYYYDMDDEECGYTWLEDVYGENWYKYEENKKLLEDYIDIKKFARDVMYDYSEQDGFYFHNY